MSQSKNVNPSWMLEICTMFSSVVQKMFKFNISFFFEEVKKLLIEFNEIEHIELNQKFFKSLRREISGNKMFDFICNTMVRGNSIPLFFNRRIMQTEYVSTNKSIAQLHEELKCDPLSTDQFLALLSLLVFKFNDEQKIKTLLNFKPYEYQKYYTYVEVHYGEGNKDTIHVLALIEQRSGGRLQCSVIEDTSEDRKVTIPKESWYIYLGLKA